MYKASCHGKKNELQCHRISLGVYFVTGFIKHIHLARGTGSEVQKLNSSANENHLCGHLVARTWKYQVLEQAAFLATLGWTGLIPGNGIVTPVHEERGSTS